MNSPLWPSMPYVTWPPSCLPLWSHLLLLSFSFTSVALLAAILICQHVKLVLILEVMHLLFFLCEMLFLHIIRLSHFHCPIHRLIKTVPQRILSRSSQQCRPLYQLTPLHSLFYFVCSTYYLQSDILK